MSPHVFRTGVGRNSSASFSDLTMAQKPFRADGWFVHPSNSLARDVTDSASQSLFSTIGKIPTLGIGAVNPSGATLNRQDAIVLASGV